MSCRISLLFLIITIASCQQPESKALPSYLDALEYLIVSENKGDRFHGTIVVGNQDSVIFQKAIGIADRVWDVPMQHDVRFDIASLNKSFIAALVLLAVEEGKLQVEDKLTDRLQKYSYEGRLDTAITLHQMLTHTSGLPDYDAVAPELAADGFVKFKRLHFSNAEYINFISRLPAVGAPGKQFYYSNFAYHLLAIILEDVYQQPFSGILQQKICQPLSLTQTFAPTSNEEVYPNVAEAYSYSSEEAQWKRNNFIDLTLGRRIYASASDLYQWGKAMNDTRLLSQPSLNAMQTNHLGDITTDVSYGYGWVVFDGKASYNMGNLPIDYPYIIHGGSTEGYKSMLVNIEGGRYIIALLSNVGARTDEMQLTQKIVNILMQKADED